MRVTIATMVAPLLLIGGCAANHNNPPHFTSITTPATLAARTTEATAARFSYGRGNHGEVYARDNATGAQWVLWNGTWYKLVNGTAVGYDRQDGVIVAFRPGEIGLVAMLPATRQVYAYNGAQWFSRDPATGAWQPASAPNAPLTPQYQHAPNFQLQAPDQSQYNAQQHPFSVDEQQQLEETQREIDRDRLNMLCDSYQSFGNAYSGVPGPDCYH